MVVVIYIPINLPLQRVSVESLSDVFRLKKRACSGRYRQVRAQPSWRIVAGNYALRLLLLLLPLLLRFIRWLASSLRQVMLRGHHWWGNSVYRTQDNVTRRHPEHSYVLVRAYTYFVKRQKSWNEFEALSQGNQTAKADGKRWDVNWYEENLTCCPFDLSSLADRRVADRQVNLFSKLHRQLVPQCHIFSLQCPLRAKRHDKLAGRLRSRDELEQNSHGQTDTKTHLYHAYCVTILVPLAGLM